LLQTVDGSRDEARKRRAERGIMGASESGVSVNKGYSEQRVVVTYCKNNNR